MRSYRPLSHQAIPASACARQMDQRVVITQSIYTVEVSNKDQALLMDIRMKDMINNIPIIMTFMMLEPVNCRPTCRETDGGDGQLIDSDGELIGCDGQLIGGDLQLF